MEGAGVVGAAGAGAGTGGTGGAEGAEVAGAGLIIIIIRRCTCKSVSE